MITDNTLVLIIVGLAGLFIGLLVSGLFSSRDAKARKSSRPTPEMDKEGFLEVARLWYSPTSKRIMPELDGEFIPDHASLTPDQQKKIFRISDLLGEWVRKIPAEIAQPAAKIEETTAPSPFTAAALVDEESQPSPFLETPQEESFTPAPAAYLPQAMSTVEEEFIDRDTTEDEEENLIIKPRTIAGQISLILEEMIKTTSLRDKGIRLIEREDHGVDVWVGMEKFDGVEAIPYPEAQQLIKAAAARWEKEASARGKLGAD
jgi:FtsZ-interacting cell division protein ZipA